MDIKSTLKRSWQMIWRYRTLWILGMVMALTAANSFYLGFSSESGNIPVNNKIKLSETYIIHLPGEGVTLDLTRLTEPRVIFTGESTQYHFKSLQDLADFLGMSEYSPILIEVFIMGLLLGTLALFSRYIGETALIRMVSESENGGKRLSLVQGLRLGFSVRAFRLFLIDLLVKLGLAGLVALVLFLLIVPFKVVESSGWIAIIVAFLGSVTMVIVVAVAFLLMSLLLTLIMQPVRRACVIDDLGLFASFSAGFKLLSRNFQQVGLTWLVWIASRILWAPVSVIVVIMLAPLFLVFLSAGALLGIVPVALVTGFASLFISGILPWIIGLIAGFPVFILVTILPILLIAGWVEIFKSSLWTLSYRQLTATPAD